MSHLVISKACPIIENIIQYNRIFNFNSTDNEIIFNENKKKLGEE